MDESKKYEINQCYHCGNKGLMEILHEHMEKFGGNYVNSDGSVDHDIEEHYTWILLKCPVCRKISLIQKYTDESMYNLITHIEDYYISNIYPLNSYKMDNVPSNIASAFEAALKIRNINTDLCLAGLRKVLELICKDNKAVGRTLEKKIDDMINKNVFPKEMEVAYWIIRQVGNKAVHDKVIELTKYDINEIVTLLYAIINYLYIIPNKMIKLKDKLNDLEVDEITNGV